MRFEDLLVRDGVVTQDQIDSARKSAGPAGRLDRALIELGYLREQEVLDHLGGALGLERVELRGRQVEEDVLKLVPRSLVFKHQVLPVGRHNGSLMVATSNPFDLQTLDEIHAETGLHVEPVLATEEEIGRAIKNHFGVGGETVGALVGDEAELEALKDDTDFDEMAEEASVVRLVNDILTEAIEQRTSDIHIEPTEKGLRLRYRIDGVLQPQALPPAIHRFAPAIVSRLKIMASLNIAEKRLPQDGRIEIRGRGRDIDVRVSIIPMARGEGVVLRILDKGSMSFDLGTLGMPGEVYRLWRRLIELPHGILLVTGPTGSGKTTTLYSALQEIATDDVKIITVEDPVEYQFDRIQQIQVQSKIGLTFSSGLRSILRHDPDVVLIGEIRDLETAEIATQAALTGHLVLSTLHTNDAAGAFTRLTDMGVEPFLVASTVEAVMAQRLVRRICPECKTEYAVDPVDLPPDFDASGEDSNVLHKGEGCASCRHTGYRGRQGIYELIPISDPIREMVIEHKSSTAIKSRALEEGLTTLRQDAFGKMHDGVTTLEEVLRVTKPDNLGQQMRQQAAAVGV